MANIITVPPSPAPWDIISDAIDRYSKSRQEQQAMDLQRQQVTQSGDYQNRMANVSEGQLGIQKEAQRLATDQQSYAQAKERWGAAYDQAIGPALSSGRPEDFQTAQANLKALIAQNPEFAAFAGATALRLQNGQLPADAANANAGQYDVTQTGKANTSTDPVAANYTTHRNLKADMPAYAFAQQQATDLQARGGGSTAALPKPTGNAVTDFERRATEAMPTGAQNQTAQTSITTTGMQEKGATQRTGMQVQGQKDIAKMKLSDVAGDVVGGVLADPQSYYGLPPDAKKAVLKQLGRAPSKLGSAEQDRMNAAALGRQIIDDSDGIVKKWQQRGVPITGPVLGRFNSAQGTWGEMLIPKNLPPAQSAEYEQDISQLREWLTALPIQEAKALAGGRTAYQVIEAVTKAAPSLSKSDNMFEGSVKGLRTRFDQIIDTLDNKQWGGKPPKGYVGVRERNKQGASNSADPLGLFK